MSTISTKKLYVRRLWKVSNITKATSVKKMEKIQIVSKMILNQEDYCEFHAD